VAVFRRTRRYSAAARYKRVYSSAAAALCRARRDDGCGNKTLMDADAAAAAPRGYCRHFLSVVGGSLGYMAPDEIESRSLLRALAHSYRSRQARTAQRRSLALFAGR